jgi:hypothetical protein
MRLPPCAALAALLLAARPTAAQTVAPHDQCPELSRPRKLPAAAELLDTDGIQGIVEEIAAGRRLDALFAVLVGADGAVQRLTLLGGSPDTAATGRVADVLVPRLRAQPAGELRGVRLRVQVGDGFALRVERSRMCAPVVVHSPPMGTVAVTRRVVTQEGVRPVPPRPLKVDWSLRVLVAADGSVPLVEWARRPNVPEFEEPVREAALATRYEPARIDGVAVPMWIVRGRLR